MKGPERRAFAARLLLLSTENGVWNGQKAACVFELRSSCKWAIASSEGQVLSWTRPRQPRQVTCSAETNVASKRMTVQGSVIHLCVLNMSTMYKTS